LEQSLTGHGKPTGTITWLGDHLHSSYTQHLLAIILKATCHSGKTLGGGSSINGGAWTRGVDVQYDAWSDLLETSEAEVGWNWENLQGYMKKVESFAFSISLIPISRIRSVSQKAESFTPPDARQEGKGAEYVASDHGYSGPIQVSYPEEMFSGPQQDAFMDAVVSITGMKRVKDMNGGQPNGISKTPLTMNKHDDDHRSSSASAYLTPVENDKKMWTTLTDHIVSIDLF